MSEDFGPNIISMEDEEGNEFDLEHLDTLEYNGISYMAFTPVLDGDDDDEEIEVIVLKAAVDEDGEEMLITIEDEEELDTVYEMFVERFYDEDGEFDEE